MSGRNLRLRAGYFENRDWHYPVRTLRNTVLLHGLAALVRLRLVGLRIWSPIIFYHSTLLSSTQTPNAHHQRARATLRSHQAIAIRAPLHGDVRQRVTERAAAPTTPRLQESPRTIGNSLERGNPPRCADGLTSAAAIRHWQGSVRRCLTPHITGPPSDIASNHKSCASAAPVHVVVRPSLASGSQYPAAPRLPLDALIRQTASIVPLIFFVVNEESALPFKLQGITTNHLAFRTFELSSLQKVL
jgi:hypothetical protein